MGPGDWKGKGTFVSRRKRISSMKVKIAGRDVEVNKVLVIGAERMECAAEKGMTGLETDAMDV